MSEECGEAMAANRFFKNAEPTARKEHYETNGKHTKTQNATSASSHKHVHYISCVVRNVFTGKAQQMSRKLAMS
jgi:hypothetical protein